MTQEGLISRVLATMDGLPEVPRTGRYLSLEQAQEIVDRTIAHVSGLGDAVEHRYLSGHRRRLAITLTMIPIAETPGAALLDVGCYGYMAFWAWRHLGYARVEGIELQPDRKEAVLSREIAMDGATLGLTIHNFDISREAWPIEGSYDTVLLLETLEHVNHDPSGVMGNIAARLKEEGALVMSVPNAISYKTVQEMLIGAPPWTYWFFHPDLRHEPRHAFEYTPIFFKALLGAAGLREEAFRTICAYADRAGLDEIFRLGEALSIEPRLFGETMIAQARKTAGAEIIRFPDLIYDSEAYYRSTYPQLAGQLRRALDRFAEGREGGAPSVAAALEERIRTIEEEKRRELGEALGLCDAYLEEVTALRERIGTLEEERRRELGEALGIRDACLEEAAALKERVRNIEEEKRREVGEALGLCDAYLDLAEQLRQQLNQPEHRTAAQGALAAPSHRQYEETERPSAARAELAELYARLDQAETELEAVRLSTFWRATAPARRVADHFPVAKDRLRTAVVPVVRVLRRVVRGHYRN